MPNTKEIFIRLDRCVGCHTCELACAVEHSRSKNLFAAIFEEPGPRKRVFVEFSGGLEVPVLCRHCEDAPCAAVCPTGATYHAEDEEIILHDEKKCIGCYLCLQACPFGMMGSRTEQRAVYKCDRCPDRDVPACVGSCPTRALVYTGAEAYSRDRRLRVADAISAAYPKEG